MNDENQDVREMLERKALEVKPQIDMPPGLKRRVRGRIAMNAAGAGLAVVVVGLAAFAGIRALGGGSNVGPVAPPTASNLPSPTTPARPSACTSDQLSAAADLGGAAGSRVGSIDVTNTSHDTCTIHGDPTIQLLNGSGQSFSYIDFVRTQAQWQADNLPQPNGWPVVTLRPRDTASIRLSWGNWCPTQTPTWQVEIPGSGWVNVSGMDEAGPPPCMGEGQPSDVEVGPFEPGSSASPAAP